jgi:peptidoglycan/LPS O-acetylase OafA/YrhL
MTLMALPPTLLCAWLSWNLIEQPLLNRKKLILTGVDRACSLLAELVRAILRGGEKRPSVSASR